MSVIETPDKLFGELFVAVQTGNIFADSKTFVDAVPKYNAREILREYQRKKNNPDFRLKEFVHDYFLLPEPVDVEFYADPKRPVREHIALLWDVLTREADSLENNSSILPLPNPYIVPGGRFREIYYWDSYFTMLGLASAGRVFMIENMVNNFAHLIDKVGFIPNGNRSYFCSRSQPPLFALMVELLAEELKDESIYLNFYSTLRKEYEFWMEGANQLTEANPTHRRVVKVGEYLLNRYWDDYPAPRQESYLEDLELAERCQRDDEALFRDIRAACESGWDFSSRWFEDPMKMSTIRTTQILPVDLNAILTKVENILALMAGLAGEDEQKNLYQQRAKKRSDAIRNLFYDQQAQFFCDLTLNLESTNVLSVAGAFPLFVGIANEQQAKQVSEILESQFLCSGGWVCTRIQNGQQWDFPNGWAPMQWVVYRGLCNYGYMELAEESANRWVNNNLHIYRETGKLIEKYDVEHFGQLAGGGEYEVQDGFGWTNGVLLRFMDILDL